MELFNSESSEARYGAFRALRESIPESLLAEGEFVAREFMLHTVPSTARPMIHVSRTRQAEIVLFGGDQHFGESLLFVKSGLTIKAIGGGQVQLKRFAANSETSQITCSTLVSDVIRNAVRLGADYGDIVRLLKDAKRSEALDSELVINALPKITNSYRSTHNGQPDGELSERYVREKMPQLFETETTGAAQPVSTEGKGIFARMQGLWKR